LAYLEFLKLNLVGQTSVRVDPAWATQSAILQGMAQVTLPHHLIREEDLSHALPDLAHAVGVTDAPPVRAEGIPTPIALGQIHDGKIEKATIDAYRRDYLNLGFGRWAKG
jgi:hypothetical protein